MTLPMLALLNPGSVTFWGAFAMAVTAIIGKIFGTVVMRDPVIQTFPLP